jgi:hypothetical protein
LIDDLQGTVGVHVGVEIGEKSAQMHELVINAEVEEIIFQASAEDVGPLLARIFLCDGTFSVFFSVAKCLRNFVENEIDSVFVSKKNLHSLNIDTEQSSEVDLSSDRQELEMGA